MNNFELTLLISLAAVLVAGWIMILHEIYYGYSAKESDFASPYEWKISGCRYWVKAEILREMIVFNMWDRDFDNIAEIGFVENGEWFFLDMKDDFATTDAKRLCKIIQERYAAKVSELKFMQKIGSLRIVK